jgi:hypothetical protein
MVTIFLNSFRSRYKPPLIFFKLGVQIIKLVAKFKSSQIEIDFNRFMHSQWIRPHQTSRKGALLDSHGMKIDLVFVVTRKDFDVLRFSLPKAFRSIPANLRGEVRLIVPTQDVEECMTLFKDKAIPLRVSDEEHLIEESARQVLKDKFGSRYTWVLQQILKVAAVTDSKSKATLIVDADTVLLRRKNWFNKYGQQILMPSDEYNSDYYSFLSQFGICTNPPKYTFIAHHMLIQRQFLIEAFKELGISTIRELIDLLDRTTQVHSQSPVCVDYELYGQFMFNRYSKQIVLSRWSNIGISVSRLEQICNSTFRLRFLGLFYNSASFHSWS